MELDHIFISVAKDAPEAEVLVNFGLVEGTRNTHLGQGTANRRFFFHNMMIELLWIEDYGEVQNERTQPMRLYERIATSNKKISPFGICFRPSNRNETNAPFPYWKYNPIYLPSHLAIQVASETPLIEPMWFYIPFATRQDSYSSEKLQAMNHEIKLNEVTAAVVTINQADNISDAAEIVNKIPNFKVIIGAENLLELEFDNGSAGKVHDFRSVLPLIFKW